MPMKDHLAPVEDAIRFCFLPAIFGDNVPLSNEECDLFALPARHGGLGIHNPLMDASHRLSDSRLLSRNLQAKILEWRV